MAYPKRTQYKHSKSRYRVRNWAEYNKGLRDRGSLTIWFSEEAIGAWTPAPSGKPGGQQKYSRVAIETGLTVRMVFKLGLRQTQGFLRSLSSRLGLDIKIPDYSTLSRRGKVLGKLPIFVTKTSRPLHLLIDSTGLTIHVGHMRKPPKRRAWRKLHLGVDGKTGDIVAVDLTASGARDAARVPALLKQIDRPLASVSADAAYDTTDVYESIENHRSDRSPKALITPKKNARVSTKPNASRQRNRNVRSRDKHGKRAWQKRSGYSKRAMVENTIYRYKAILGPAMRSRTVAGQRVEARLGVRILNMMTRLGMPESYKIA